MGLNLRSLIWSVGYDQIDGDRAARVGAQCWEALRIVGEDGSNHYAPKLTCATYNSRAITLSYLCTSNDVNDCLHQHQRP